MSFIDKILDVSLQDESHIKVKLFGFISLKILRPDIKKDRSLFIKTFKRYKKKNIDITTFPKATGRMKIIQDAEIVLLKELDYVCKLNNFDYWLDFGTLLGAVRHKGFIPWDDDIDVSMPREYYEKIIEAFNKNSRNKKIKINYYRRNDNTPNYIIRLYFENYPVCLDIFPYDFYGEVIKEEDRSKITEKIRSIRMPLTQKIKNDGMTMEQLSKEVENMKSQILINGYCTKNENSSLVWGVDFSHNWSQWCWNYSTIYPLKTAEFEGLECNVPNNCDEYLSQVFGNYMSYPNDIPCGHTIFKLREKTIKEIKKLIEE